MHAHRVQQADWRLSLCNNHMEIAQHGMILRQTDVCGQDEMGKAITSSAAPFGLSLGKALKRPHGSPEDHVRGIGAA